MPNLTQCVHALRTVRLLWKCVVPKPFGRSLLGLELKTPEVLLPDTAFLKLLYAAADSAQNGTRCAVSVQGDSRIYSGMTEAGDTFQLEQDKEDGSLRVLTMDGQKLQVTFSDFLIAEM